MEAQRRERRVARGYTEAVFLVSVWVGERAPGRHRLLKYVKVKEAPEAPKTAEVMAFALSLPWKLDVNPDCWKCTILWLQNISNQVGNDLEMFYLLAGFPSARRYHAGQWGRKFLNGLTQPWTLYVTRPTCQAGCIPWRNSDMKIMGVTNYFWIGFEIPSMSKNAIGWRGPGGWGPYPAVC